METILSAVMFILVILWLVYFAVEIHKALAARKSLRMANEIHERIGLAKTDSDFENINESLGEWKKDIPKDHLDLFKSVQDYYNCASKYKS